MEKNLSSLAITFLLTLAACSGQQFSEASSQSSSSKPADTGNPFANSISQPLVKNMYTADPSAHVFNGKIFIYPSHDIEANIAENDNGDHFNMKDYHIFSMDKI